MLKFFDKRFDYLTTKRQALIELETAITNGSFLDNVYIDRLSNALKSFTGNEYCLLTKSGTQSLIVALMCLGVGKDDYVVTTSYTFIATISAIKAVGARPLLVDIDKDTWNMDVEQLEKVLQENKRIKCILPVDIFGNPCDYDSILTLSNKYKIPVLEDACQSFTAEYKGKKTCNVGCDMASVSFYPTKPFGGMGEGGALFTNNEDLYLKAKSILNHGASIDNNYNCVMDGTNGAFDTLHAIFLLEKMRTVNDVLEQRNKIAQSYAKLNGIIMQKVEKDAKSAWCRIQVCGNNELFSKYFELDYLYTKNIYDNDLYSGLKTEYNSTNVDKVSHGSVSLPIYSGINISELEKSIQEINSNKI